MDIEYGRVENYHQEPENKPTHSSQGVAGMVVSIVSIGLWVMGFGGLISLAGSIVGLILSIGARKKIKTDNYALTGIIVSSINLGLSAITTLISIFLAGLIILYLIFVFFLGFVYM